MSKHEDETVVLYEGTKSIWKTKTNISITIIQHSNCACLEVIAYNPALDVEASRIYVKSFTVSAKMNHSELHDKVAIEKEMYIRKKKPYNVQDITDKISREMSVNFLLVRINMPENLPPRAFKIILSPSVGDPIDSVTGQADYACGRPEKLIPYVIKHMRGAVTLDEFHTKVNEFDQEKAGILDHCKAATELTKQAKQSVNLNIYNISEETRAKLDRTVLKANALAKLRIQNENIQNQSDSSGHLPAVADSQNSGTEKDTAITRKTNRLGSMLRRSIDDSHILENTNFSLNNSSFHNEKKETRPESPNNNIKDTEWSISKNDHRSTKRRVINRKKSIQKLLNGENINHLPAGLVLQPLNHHKTNKLGRSSHTVNHNAFAAPDGSSKTITNDTADDTVPYGEDCDGTGDGTDDRVMHYAAVFDRDGNPVQYSDTESDDSSGEDEDDDDEHDGTSSLSSHSSDSDHHHSHSNGHNHSRHSNRHSIKNSTRRNTRDVVEYESNGYPKPYVRPGALILTKDPSLRFTGIEHERSGGIKSNSITEAKRKHLKGSDRKPKLKDKKHYTSRQDVTSTSTSTSAAITSTSAVVVTPQALTQALLNREHSNHISGLKVLNRLSSFRNVQDNEYSYASHIISPKSVTSTCTVTNVSNNIGGCAMTSSDNKSLPNPKGLSGLNSPTAKARSTLTRAATSKSATPTSGGALPLGSPTNNNKSPHTSTGAVLSPLLMRGATARNELDVVREIDSEYMFNTTTAVNTVAAPVAVAADGSDANRTYGHKTLSTLINSGQANTLALKLPGPISTSRSRTNSNASASGGNNGGTPTHSSTAGSHGSTPGHPPLRELAKLSLKSPTSAAAVAGSSTFQYSKTAPLGSLSAGTSKEKGGADYTGSISGNNSSTLAAASTLSKVRLQPMTPTATGCAATAAITSMASVSTLSSQSPKSNPPGHLNLPPLMSPCNNNNNQSSYQPHGGSSGCTSPSINRGLNSSGMQNNSVVTSPHNKHSPLFSRERANSRI